MYLIVAVKSWQAKTLGHFRWKKNVTKCSIFISPHITCCRKSCYLWNLCNMLLGFKELTYFGSQRTLNRENELRFFHRLLAGLPFFDCLKIKCLKPVLKDILLNCLRFGGIKLRNITIILQLSLKLLNNIYQERNASKCIKRSFISYQALKKIMQILIFVCVFFFFLNSMLYSLKNKLKLADFSLIICKQESNNKYFLMENQIDSWTIFEYKQEQNWYKKCIYIYTLFIKSESSHHTYTDKI